MDEKTIDAIEKGKCRGYNCNIIENTVEYLCYYEIFKKENKYVAFYKKVEFEHLDNFEDYQIELVQKYDTLQEAIIFIEEHGGDINLFKGMKG